MDQSIKCFPCKPEDLTVTPRRHVQKILGVVVCAWNPSAGEVATGRFLGLAGQLAKPT